MASIKVTKNVNPITIRIGQRTVKKVVASEKAATQTLNTLEKLEDVQDVDVSARANRTLIMYDATSQKYLHVDPAQIVDLADSVDDDAYDAGTF
jgi:acetolactate synthase regulatory subunit